MTQPNPRPRLALESAVVLILLITAIAIIPNDAFQEWYVTHHAHIQVTHDFNYYNHDPIGDLVDWMSDNVLVPIWNFLFENDMIRNLVAPAIATGIIGGLAWGVTKSIIQS